MDKLKIFNNLLIKEHDGDNFVYELQILLNKPVDDNIKTIDLNTVLEVCKYNKFNIRMENTIKKLFLSSFEEVVYYINSIGYDLSMVFRDFIKDISNKGITTTFETKPEPGILKTSLDPIMKSFVYLGRFVD